MAGLGRMYPESLEGGVPGYRMGLEPYADLAGLPGIWPPLWGLAWNSACCLAGLAWGV